MAKSRSVFKFQGTIKDITFVHSPTYGDHIRAKRGTYTTVEINEAFKVENKNLIDANVPAKIFKNAIDPFRKEIHEGQFWQRLLKVFRKQLKQHGTFDFAKLEQIEMHSRHTFKRFMNVQSTTEVDKEKSSLRVALQYGSHPTFKGKGINGYTLTLIAIFPDLTKETSTTTSISSKVISLARTVKPPQFQLDVPKEAQCFVLCIKIQACKDDAVDGGRTTTGLRVLEAGTIV